MCMLSLRCLLAAGSSDFWFFLTEKGFQINPSPCNSTKPTPRVCVLYDGNKNKILHLHHHTVTNNLLNKSRKLLNWGLNYFNIFTSILLVEKFYIFIQSSLNFVPEGSIDNKSGLVQVLTWCQSGNKQLSEILYGVTEPQSINSLRLSDAHMHQ